MQIRRLKACRFVFLFLLIMIAVKLFNIQAITGQQYSTEAAMQQSRNRIIYRERGDILDRNGISFTGRDTYWKAILQPVTLLNNPNALRIITDVLGFDAAYLKEQLSKDNLPYITNITAAQARAISDSSLTGISVIDLRKRYNEHTLAAHILGYVDESGAEGLAGIEKAYQNTLKRGGGVYAGILADAGNSYMDEFGYRIWNSMGKERLNIQLTLDYHLQSIVESTMDRMVDKGAVVLLDILNGDILAISSRPDFNPSNINPSLSDEEQPLFNRALGTYIPGSIFKMITAAAALENNFSPDVMYNCPGYVDLGGLKMKCTSYDEGGHGNINMVQAFARSCNSYFINLGMEVGRDKILAMADKFGLGRKTGLENEGIEESAGILPSYIGNASPAEIGNISIGQGEILVSPIQAANIASVIANGGLLHDVSLIKAIVNSQGEKVRNVSVPKWSRAISKETAAALQGMMLLTVQSGTGKWADIGGHGGSAGKTGSAETGWVKDNRNILHAWFSGYFPVDCPRYALCVFIEDGQSGSSSAAPIFAEISAQIMDAGF
ncbi:MAG: penicillin-binding protein 2 [Clostridiaceae bacterium]|nr:penicillin-binding protein 2 [Clostridiaceae bacterium]